MPETFAVLHAHMASFGYEHAETPVIEPAELFLTKAGDQIIERLLTFTRAGKDYALRPEFTASAVSRYLQTDQACVRWQFSGAIFQDANGHGYQTHSIGAELIGYAGSIADAEVIALAAQGLQKLGVEGWTLRVGHVGLTRHLLNRFEIDERTLRFILNQKHTLQNRQLGKTFVIEQIDQAFAGSKPNATHYETTDQAEHVLDTLLTSSQWGVTLGGRTREDIAQRLVRKQQIAAKREQVIQLLGFLETWSALDTPLENALDEIQGFIAPDDSEGQRLFDEWRTTLNQLTAVYGIPLQNIILQPDMARTWDYYTGVVFEIHVQEVLLAGGGRYDELTRLVGGAQNVPAVGFAYHTEALRRYLIPPTEHPVVLIREDAAQAALWWANTLRQAGIPVSVLPAGYQGANIADCMGDTLQLNGKTYHKDQITNLIQILQPKEGR